PGRSLPQPCLSPSSRAVPACSSTASSSIRWLAARAYTEPMTSQAAPNRLAGETSPYLLQHAHNPVDWYPWGPEALERARAEDKPLLLSVGYPACPPGHVMARESLGDAETAG